MKILLADDDVQILRSMKSGIDWSGLGFLEIHTAENGIDALAAYKRERPEIVITDIRMPGLDGLELAREIRKISEITQILILSGYADFQYAATAMQFGAFAYELKPLRVKKLIDLVRKAAAEANRIKEQERAVAGYRFSRRLDLLQGAIRRGVAEEERSELEKLAGFPLDGSLCCAVFELDRKRGESGKSDPLEDMGRRDIFESLIVSSKPADMFCVPFPAGRLVCVWRAASSGPADRAIRPLFLRLNQALRPLGRTLSAGVSGIGRIGRIAQLSAEAESALDAALYSGRESFNLFSKHPAANGFPAVPHMENALRAAVQSLDRPAAFAAIEGELCRIREERSLNREQVRTVCQALLMAGLRALGEIGIGALEIDGSPAGANGLPGPLLFNECHILDDFCASMKEALDQLFSRVEALTTYRNQPLVRRSVDYIRLHYAEDLSIKKLSSALSVSPNYFSHQFKKEVGTAFRHYLNETRLEEARRLLLTTGLRNYEVANRVGFRDYQYFLKLFRASAGTSPSLFRIEGRLEKKTVP